ncbi:MAG: cytochrome c [Candidatus Thiodiazotropha endolucinida]
MKKTTCLAGICLAGSLLTGCSDNNDFKPAAGMDGMDIYANACSNCHGVNGSGKFGFLLKLSGTDSNTEEIVDKIRNGGHIMPAFPNIDTRHVGLVAAYIKTL